MSKTQKITVVKPFKFNDNGVLIPFAVGTHTVENHIADHPYTKNFIGELPPDEEKNELEQALASANGRIGELEELLTANVDAAALDAANKRIGELEALVSAYELAAKPAAKAKK